MSDRTVDDMLKDKFVGKKHVDAAVRHFGRMVQDYQQGKWDDANAKAGKFVEAALKALVTEAGDTPASGKAFKAGAVLDTIDKKTALPDSLRLTIPRACRFVYEIASNRGARHDAEEIEANEMDAKAVMALCSWILAEMVSYSQKGMDLDEAKEAVDGLMRRKYPFMEEIDGRVYWDIASSAREAALLILYGVYPKRMSEESLARQVVRHGYSQNNANVAVRRIRTRVDNDGHGNLKLRNLGVREAEELIQKAENNR
jgi:HEPN domain-containing protein